MEGQQRLVRSQLTHSIVFGAVTTFQFMHIERGKHGGEGGNGPRI